MRLLHTSDWHLGRSFHGVSLLDEQAAAITRIVALAREHEVEAVLIAGDLYDRAIPPAEAVALFNDALARLSAGGTAVVAIAGNHDSHVRVSVYDPLLSTFNITIRGDVRRAHEPVLLTPRGGGAPVAIYPLPYLEPAVDGPALSGEPGRLRHEQVTRLALARLRADLSGRPGHRAVLVAHTFVAGGESCESERELTVGNVDRVSVEAFAGFDYVALGHLHRSQQLAGPRIAYSGTPLPYSFSEQDHIKSVRIVELAAAPGAPEPAAVQVIPLQVGRPLRTLRGPIEALCHDPAHAPAEAARVRAILTDDTLPLQAMARLRARFPHIAELRHEPPELVRASGDERHRQVRQASSPLALATAFFADQQGRPPSDAEAELLEAALAQALRGGER
ncbi:exonuclease SbcCD subunit D [Synechococcus sp. CS-1325]|uniref:exonuclease SbcCD subunit D n=1 Tax=unclassified Synechococcus TaxID=2626047 RepID=UPI000DB0EF54|nr:MULTISPECIES: exonuclease SbcCD subunit D [unclassified Synechococcus]MCT0199069.1 exonuclease SbcCD subunit D [Synechococcus sp. CS-1325]MCT0212539.1 exonuclease SbcCD subunit D [Synechococcus sp. CS-1326]MCT0232055.1 exonuclease SbcCD subunit D [Synechococcus sp. CS-1327]PZU99498.1 MAG: exonuclease sbcCD subunit D [Cyanobium sp.]